MFRQKQRGSMPGYTDLDGNDCSETYRSWESFSTKLSALLDQGMTAAA